MAPKIKLGEVLGYNPQKLRIGMQTGQTEVVVLQQQISLSESNLQTWRQYRRNGTYEVEDCDDRITKETKHVETLQAQIERKKRQITQYRDYLDIIQANAGGPEALQRKLEEIQNRESVS